MTYFCVIMIWLNDDNSNSMSKSEKSVFDTRLEHQARLFKALAHPARLSILQYLAEINTCITGDIADELPLSRSTVNQHLTVLKDAGLISGTVEGVKTNYCLNPHNIDELRQTLTHFIDQINTNMLNDCC